MQVIDKFLEEERLPNSFRNTASRYFDPVVDALLRYRASMKEPVFIGLVGCQGSGKSTLCKYMANSLEEQGAKVVSLSLDDFYLGKLDRKHLAESVHPLFATRGVPCTHDVSRIREVLEAIRENTGEIKLPAFSKATDDVLPPENEIVIATNPDFVIFEGWCWGVESVDEALLDDPCNALEETEDPERIWRLEVNRALRQSYEPLYRFFDLWCFLKAPSFASVYEWRLEQEKKLIDSLKPEDAADGILDEKSLKRFIAHYERLTERLLDTFSTRADIVWELGDDRHVQHMRVQGEVAKKGFELCDH